MISMISIIIILVPLESNILTNRRKIIPKEKTQYSSRQKKNYTQRKNQIFFQTQKKDYTQSKKKTPIFFFHTQKKNLYTKKTLALE
jgi:hypothetical protein